MSQNARLSATVYGVVQGVGFRYFVRKRARFLGLVGYARNLISGNAVDVVAEGDRTSLEHLLSDLRKGPPGSEVEDVQVFWQPFEGNYSTFEIKR